MLGMIAWRFTRGFVAGAVASMATIVVVLKAETFADLPRFFAVLAVSLVVGGIAGGLLALDKWIRSTPFE